MTFFVTLLSYKFLIGRYSKCHSSNLNGFNFGPGKTPYAVGIVWYTVTEHYASLESVEMAIKGIFNTYCNRSLNKMEKDEESVSGYRLTERLQTRGPPPPSDLLTLVS